MLLFHPPGIDSRFFLRCRTIPAPKYLHPQPSVEQVRRLWEEWHVHLLNSGRVHLAERMFPWFLFRELMVVSLESVRYVAEAFEAVTKGCTKECNGLMKRSSF